MWGVAGCGVRISDFVGVVCADVLHDLRWSQRLTALQQRGEGGAIAAPGQRHSAANRTADTEDSRATE